MAYNSYTRVNWKNKPDLTTPINSTNLNIMDKGIEDLNIAVEDLNIAVGNGWIDANETWTYASVDDPTGVITISGDKTTKYSLGMRIMFTNATNVIYGIITAISYSSPNTTLTFLHEIDPTDNQALYLMANSTITANYYSNMKVPYGFPLNPDKWSIFYIDENYRSKASPTSGTWYNINSASLSVPIGLWKIGFFAMIGGYNDSAGTKNLSSTLSTSNNSQSDKELTNIIDGYGIDFKIYQSAEKIISLDVKTPFYLLTSTVTVGMTEIRNWGGGANPPNTIYCKCAYL